MDGWQKIIDDKEVKDYPQAQIVNGEWYFPTYGCDSLQMAIQEAKQKVFDDIEEKMYLLAVQVNEWRELKEKHLHPIPDKINK